MLFRSQKRVEGNNYDRRKSVVEYDEVLRKQREVIYKQRNDILSIEDMEPVIIRMMNSVVTRYIPRYAKPESKTLEIDSSMLYKDFILKFFNASNIDEDEFEGMKVDEVKEKITKMFMDNLNEKKSAIPLEIYHEFLKVILLRIVDSFWMDHIDAMSDLRQSIGLKSYAQLNPLREYQDLGFQMFDEMICNIEDHVTLNVSRAQIRDNLEREQVAKPTGTSGGSDDEVKKKPIVKKQQKIGRNDPCPCGSGKKYKNCCGRDQQ